MCDFSLIYSYCRILSAKEEGRGQARNVNQTVELTDEELVHGATHATGQRHLRRSDVDAQVDAVLKLFFVVVEFHVHRTRFEPLA